MQSSDGVFWNKVDKKWMNLSKKRDNLANMFNKTYVKSKKYSNENDLFWAGKMDKKCVSSHVWPYTSKNILKKVTLQIYIYYTVWFFSLNGLIHVQNNKYPFDFEISKWVEGNKKDTEKSSLTIR